VARALWALPLVAGQVADGDLLLPHEKAAPLVRERSLRCPNDDA